MESQFEELAQNLDIIIATPSRLMHHLTEIDDMSLHTVEYVVFDEADCLFGMCFAEQLHKILSQLSENCQTMFFSATMPSALAKFAEVGLRAKRKVCSIVSTKHYVEFLYTSFREEGIEPSVCYGEMDQDRKIHISRFRSRKTMLLIVIDVVVLGIDIPLLDNVINWDFPSKPKIIVHLVGRAARAGQTGTAYSFVTSEDMPSLLDLHPFLSKLIKAAPTKEEVL